MRRTKRNPGKGFLIKPEKLRNIHSITKEMENLFRESLEVTDMFCCRPWPGWSMTNEAQSEGPSSGRAPQPGSSRWQVSELAALWCSRPWVPALVTMWPLASVAGWLSANIQGLTLNGSTGLSWQHSFQLPSWVGHLAHGCVSDQWRWESTYGPEQTHPFSWEKNFLWGAQQCRRSVCVRCGDVGHCSAYTGSEKLRGSFCLYCLAWLAKQNKWLIQDPTVNTKYELLRFLHANTLFKECTVKEMGEEIGQVELHSGKQVMARNATNDPCR